MGLENRLKVEILSVSKILRKNCPMSFLNRSLKALRYLTRSGLSVQVNACLVNRLCYAVITSLVLKR